MRFLSVAGSTRRSEFLKSTTEDLDFVIDLNLRGPYICAREAGKIMKAQGGGKIINISSLMSVLGRATIQPYNATKFAINGLTRGLACELGPYNIQVSRGHHPVVCVYACPMFRTVMSFFETASSPTTVAGVYLCMPHIGQCHRSWLLRDRSDPGSAGPERLQ